MRMMPIYTAENCKMAYQLRWSLTLFWRSPPYTEDWIPALRAATKADGIRILRHRFAQPDRSLFLVSTRPEIRPSMISQFVKGRLQRLVRDKFPRAFQRNFDLQSIGSTKREKVEAYVAAQLSHHGVDNDRLRDLFSDMQIVNTDVDLSKPRFTAHGRYSCNLHMVFVHSGRQAEHRREVWVAVREMIRNASLKKGHLLSRLGVVPDHLHLTVGTHPDESPQVVALSYMNNIAYAHGMRAVLAHGCYIAGFGEYDLGAIRDQ